MSSASESTARDLLRKCWDVLVEHVDDRARSLAHKLYAQSVLEEDELQDILKEADGDRGTRLLFMLNKKRWEEGVKFLQILSKLPDVPANVVATVNTVLSDSVRGKYDNWHNLYCRTTANEWVY